MIKIIEQCVKESGVKAVFRRKIIRGKLNLYTITYLGLDDKYHKLQLFFNDSDIFGFEKPKTNLIGVSDNSLKDKIKDLITSHDSSKECSDSCIKIDDNKKIDQFIEQYEDFLKTQIEKIVVKGIEILDLRVYMSPVALIIIYYNYNGKIREPMKMLIGSSNVVPELSESEMEFIGEINTIISYGGSLCRI